MRTGTVSYKLEDLKKGVIIPIGFVGENDFTKVFFDAEEIYKKYPSASVSMKVQPPKGGVYPATVTRDGNTVIWQVKEADVANRGGGELQLTFIDGETKIKTYIAKTDVKRSLAGNGPAPDPIQDFVDNAEEVLDDLEAMDTIAKNAQAGDIGKALSPKTVENGVVTEWQYVEPGGGTEDYDDLDNKPAIGGVTLSGDKSLTDLGIASADSVSELSGDVADVKTAIQGKAPVINTSITEKYTKYSDVKTADNSLLKSVSVTGLGLDRLYYAGAKNILGDLSNVFCSTLGGFTSVDVEEDHIVLTGTFSSNVYFGEKKISYDRLTLPNVIPANTDIYFGVIPKGNSSGGSDKYRFVCKLLDENGNSISGLSNFEARIYGSETWLYKKTPSVNVKYVNLYIYRSGSSDTPWVCDDLDVYPLLFASSNVVLSNTEIEEGEKYNLPSSILTTWTELTTTPFEHTINYDADTKHYVDENIPANVITTENIADNIPQEYVTEEKLIYITPEMYGAVGDGVTDDTTALQNCINAACAESVTLPVRGYGKYKITSSIVISANNKILDIYINNTVYTGNDVAYKITANFSSFVFRTIYATDGGNTAACIRLYNTFTVSRLRCDYMKSNGNCVEFIQNAAGSLHYGLFEIQSMWSLNGNAIYVSCIGETFCPNEIDFYGKLIRCGNGYAVYVVRNALDYSCGSESFRLHNYSLENAKNGIYGNVRLIGCRTCECMLKNDTDSTAGHIFDFTDAIPMSWIDDSGDFVWYRSVKIEDAMTYQDALDMVKARFEAGYPEDVSWYPICRQMVHSYAKIGRCGYDSTTGGTLYAYWNHLAFKPDDEVYYLAQNAIINLGNKDQSIHKHLFPTVIDVDTNTTIYMDDSYCCIAINDVKIIQHTGKEAIVYDKNNNKIFDGTGLGEGVYHLRCMFTQLSGVSVTLTNGTVKTLDYDWENIYTGNNEIWIVTKENIT